MVVAALDRAVRTVVERCLRVSDGETVLVVADPGNADLGTALMDAARAAGGDAVLTILPPNPGRGTEPPAPVAAAFAAADIFIAPCLPSLSHTSARKRASEGGARGATMPGVTADLLARLMSADFDAMSARCHAVASLLSEADEAHMTCPRGTDMRFDLRGRPAIADNGDLGTPGAFGNLPCGEGFASPAGGEGTIVASSLFQRLTVDDPVRLTVHGGRLVAAEGETGATFLAHLDVPGPLGRNLAELGIGTNDRATLTGNTLEDEKILGTAHIAFGASAGIGGTVTVPVHEDVVVLDPSLWIGATQVLDGGRYVLTT
ncbi:MAG: aminopeptidase [Solirubrobacterales bacterium]|nr:aminopeptidase [Solirubrobacterales bacterium]